MLRHAAVRIPVAAAAVRRVGYWLPCDTAGQEVRWRTTEQKVHLQRIEEPEATVARRDTDRCAGRCRGQLWAAASKTLSRQSESSPLPSNARGHAITRVLVEQC